MFKRLIYILTLLLPLQVTAQLFPLSDHYTDNALVINPAYAGSHDALSAAVQYRDQWVGFRDAPKSSMISLHTPLASDRMGLGIMMIRNTFGIYRENSFMGSYAYRFGFNRGRLALGLGFGLTGYRVSWNKLEATDNDDQALQDNSSTAVLPDFSLGAYYYTKKYYVGLSLPFFFSHVIDENTGRYTLRNNTSDYNYILSGGYELEMGSAVRLLPALLLKYNPSTKVQTDLYVKLLLKDRIGVGVGYRSRHVIMGMLQCRINDQLKINYSYDFDRGSMGTYKNGSHEVVLGYVFRYNREVPGPRQF